MPIPLLAFLGAAAGQPFLDQLIQALFGQKIPQDVKNLQTTLTSQGQTLAGSPGLNKSVIDALFGKNFENILGAVKGQNAATAEAFGRTGASGSGAAIEAAKKNAWAAEGIKAGTARDILIANEEQKRKDLALATQILGAGYGGVELSAGLRNMTQGPNLIGAMTSAELMSMLTGGGRGDILGTYAAANKTSPGPSTTGYSDLGLPDLSIYGSPTLVNTPLQTGGSISADLMKSLFGW